MKRFPLLVGIVALAVLIAAPGFAENVTRKVSVRGNAEVKIVPDQVILTLGVETFDSTMGNAKADNDRRTTAILAVATSTDGVDNNNVKTDYLQINPKHRSEHNRSTEIVGYFVRKTITITLDDIDQFEPLLASVLEAGATHVHGIAFKTTELRKHRDKARAMAIKAAREKAEALCGELDEHIGNVITAMRAVAPQLGL